MLDAEASVGSDEGSEPPKATMKALNGLDPLRDLLGDIITRLEALEAHIGKAHPSPHLQVPKSPVPVKLTFHGTSQVVLTAQRWKKLTLGTAGRESASVKAYDDYVKSCVVPFSKTCDDLGGMGTIGRLLQDAWEGVRTIVVLASRSKPPQGDLAVALAPFIGPTQDAVKKIREIRADKDFDRHQKAIFEMLGCLSWVFMQAPKQLPASFVKEALGSAQFWSNRIRKDFKGKDSVQIEFCDNLNKVVTGLVEYIEQYHKAGLTFNPRGLSLTEAGLRLSDEPFDELKSPSVHKRHPTLGQVVGGGNMVGLMDELNKRKSTDGSSAATGLKHVSGYCNPGITHSLLNICRYRFRRTNRRGGKSTRTVS